MLKSDQINELAAALAKAQAEYLPIQKNRTVHVTTRTGGSYDFDYADLDEIIAKTRPALTKNGLSVSHLFGDGTLTTILMHSSGQYVAETTSLPMDGTSQEIGAKVTYRTRYQYKGIVGVSGELDTDGEGADTVKEKTTKKATAEPYITTEQAVEVARLVHETKSDEKKMLEVYKADKIEHIKASDFEKVITQLGSKLLKQKGL